jgi:hypothetical protein
MEFIHNFNRALTTKPINLSVHYPRKRKRNNQIQVVYIIEYV